MSPKLPVRGVKLTDLFRGQDFRDIVLLSAAKE